MLQKYKKIFQITKLFTKYLIFIYVTLICYSNNKYIIILIIILNKVPKYKIYK